MSLIESDSIELKPVAEPAETHTDDFWPDLRLSQTDVHNILNCADFADALINGEITIKLRGGKDE